MKLVEAQEIVRDMNRRPYGWLKASGLDWIREAIRTIEDRKSATNADRQVAESVKRKIMRGW